MVCILWGSPLNLARFTLLSSATNLPKWMKSSGRSKPLAHRWRRSLLMLSGSSATAHSGILGQVFTLTYSLTCPRGLESCCAEKTRQTCNLSKLSLGCTMWAHIDSQHINHSPATTGAQKKMPKVADMSHHCLPTHGIGIAHDSGHSSPHADLRGSPGWHKSTRAFLSVNMTNMHCLVAMCCQYPGHIEVKGHDPIRYQQVAAGETWVEMVANDWMNADTCASLSFKDNSNYTSS